MKRLAPDLPLLRWSILLLFESFFMDFVALFFLMLLFFARKTVEMRRLKSENVMLYCCLRRKTLRCVRRIESLGLDEASRSAFPARPSSVQKKHRFWTHPSMVGHLESYLKIHEYGRN